MIPSPGKTLKAAIAAVPAARYALGVAGIAAALAIIFAFELGPAVSAIGIIVMLVLMTGLLVFASLADGGKSPAPAVSGPLELPGKVMVWVFVLLICATGVMAFTITFFGAPRTWNEILGPGYARSGSILRTGGRNLDGNSGIDGRAMSVKKALVAPDSAQFILNLGSRRLWTWNGTSTGDNVKDYGFEITIDGAYKFGFSHWKTALSQPDSGSLPDLLHSGQLAIWAITDGGSRATRVSDARILAEARDSLLILRILDRSTLAQLFSSRPDSALAEFKIPGSVVARTPFRIHYTMK